VHPFLGARDPMPPLSVKTPSAWYCSVLSRVSSIIIFEYSIGKMKLDA
jgi:hypothetical protein